jgi:hypothetical protein
MTSELKLVIENAGEGAAPAKPDVATMNPMDALNRRDIELIKKSLVGLHRDSAEMRNTMVAIHHRNNTVPSKSFFLTLGLVGFIGISGLAIMRPQLHAALQHVPALARLADDIKAR